MLKKNYKNKYNSGVTLVELLVVISIFMVISSITIFSYSKFNSSLSTQNLADDIALSIRRAQGYAIGVRGASGSMFNIGYGVHFTANPNISDLQVGSNKSFVLFADIDNNNQYDDNSSACGNPVLNNECLELLSIKSKDKISGIYLNDEVISRDITDTVDLLFRRPNPEAVFCYKVGGVGSCSATPISSLKIKISTDDDPNIYKTIYISNNGQISVSN